MDKQSSWPPSLHPPSLAAPMGRGTAFFSRGCQALPPDTCTLTVRWLALVGRGGPWGLGEWQKSRTPSLQPELSFNSWTQGDLGRVTANQTSHKARTDPPCTWSCGNTAANPVWRQEGGDGPLRWTPTGMPGFPAAGRSEGQEEPFLCMWVSSACTSPHFQTPSPQA